MRYSGDETVLRLESASSFRRWAVSTNERIWLRSINARWTRRYVSSRIASHENVLNRKHRTKRLSQNPISPGYFVERKRKKHAYGTPRFVIPRSAGNSCWQTYFFAFNTAEVVEWLVARLSIERNWGQSVAGGAAMRKEKGIGRRKLQTSVAKRGISPSKAQQKLAQGFGLPARKGKEGWEGERRGCARECQLMSETRQWMGGQGSGARAGKSAEKGSRRKKSIRLEKTWQARGENGRAEYLKTFASQLYCIKPENTLYVCVCVCACVCVYVCVVDGGMNGKGKEGTD